jgi:serine/threonine protein kinase
MADFSQVQWPGWQVDRLLGTGSFGAVYEISRTVVDNLERSALKVIPIPSNRDEVTKLRSEGYDDASIAAHFRKLADEIIGEYAMMMKMKGHANIVYCDDFRVVPRGNEIGWNVYIKMELLTPLLRILPSFYSESLTVQLGRDICNALIQCGKQNILHRDIKPENVFYSEGGSFKLGDFGIAKIADRVTFGTRIGTFDYMAPEVYRNEPYGFAADQYALGIMLYWCMNEWRTPFLSRGGRVPTDAEKEQAWNRRTSGEPLPPPAWGSPELKAVVLRACAFRPQDRFPTVAHMLEALQAIEAAPFRTDVLLPKQSQPVAPAMFRAPCLDELG